MCNREIQTTYDPHKKEISVSMWSKTVGFEPGPSHCETGANHYTTVQPAGFLFIWELSVLFLCLECS